MRPSDKSQIEDLMARKPVRDPQGWDDKPPSHGDVITDDVKSKGDIKNEKINWWDCRAKFKIFLG